MKKIIALVLVIALCCSVSVGLTLAYLTDRDSKANVFTVGDVEIKLEEDFEDGATLIPGVDIEKEPTITNTGKNDAWVWATIAIPAAFDNEDASKNVIHFNYSKESVAKGLWNWQGDGDWMIETVTYDDVEYNVYTVLYETALKPGETTAQPVMYKVYMDPHVDIDPDGNVYHVENGVAEDLKWNVNKYGNPIIYVGAYAIQTDGFETVLDAYNAYTEQWTTDAGVNNGVEWGDTVAMASDSDALAAALKNDETNDYVLVTDDIDVGAQVFVVDGGVLDGDGHTLVVDSGSASYESGLTVAEGTAKNVTVTGAFRGLGVGGSGASAMTGDVYYENVIVKGATYGVNIGVGNGHKLYMTDCVFGDWNSYSGLSGAEFNGCTFTSEGNYYASQRISANATFTYTNCNFEQNTYDNVDGSDNYFLDSYGNGTIKLVNCKMNGILVTSENVNDLFQVANVTVVVENT